MAGANLKVNVDFFQLKKFGEALERAPQHLLRSMGKGFYRIGRSDIDKLKAEQLSGSGKLKVKFKGLMKAFKHWSTDARKMRSLDELKLEEFTGWKAAAIFQTGGVIKPKGGKLLTILLPAARSASGKRKWSQQEFKSMIKDGTFKVIQTKNGPIVIKEKGGLTKKGKAKKGTRAELLAVLRPSSKQQKRLDFFENHSRNAAEHQRILEAAAQEALQRVVGGTK